MVVRTPCPCPKGWDCEIIRQRSGAAPHRAKWKRHNADQVALIRGHPDAFPPGHPVYERYIGGGADG